MYRQYCFLLFCFTLIFSSSCTKDDTSSKDEREEVASEIQLANQFVLSYGETYYLWCDKVDYSNKDPKYINDPFELFDQLIYKKLDIWSYLTDDADELFNSYNGVETSYGYSVGLGKFTNSNSYFGVVKFVYPNSPAADAGMKRGDIIMKIDGSDITDENYLYLYYSSKIELQLGQYRASENVIAVSDKKVNLTASEVTVEAVNAYSIIEKGGYKIGYICYTDYVASSHTQLNKICSEFKAAGVTELVLDLRYNPGGASVSAQYLSSLFVPQKHIQNGDIFLKEMWNEMVAEYLKSNGEKLYSVFSKDALPYNLNLDKIYILVTSGTASASEATIVGLEPYMDVVTIGTKTHGKYCAALLLQALDKNGNVLQSIKNWAMSLVAYKFANSAGFTDFTGGLTPDYEVEDNLITAVYPFGDINDPHLAKALELIVGTKSGLSDVAEAGRSKFEYDPLEKETRQLNGRRGGFIEIR